MAQRVSQLDEITTVDSLDELYGVDVSDLTHSPDGTSVKFKKSNLLKEYATLTGEETLTNKTLTTPIINTPKLNEDVEVTIKSSELNGMLTGWIPANETWTYASADAPTFTFTIAADVTAKYSAGMKIKLTQTTVKYFIITAVSAYSGGNTTITVYGGTDYDLANASITSPYYSMVKAPQGFPLSPTKWTVEATDTSTRIQGTPTANTYYNLGSLSIDVPIGVWELGFQVNAGGNKATGQNIAVRVALSTSASSVSDGRLSARINGNNNISIIASMTVYDYKEISSKTTYYLILGDVANVSLDNIYFVGSAQTTIIRATCAYL